jgi:REP element-mobilizing transposase RayT
MATHVSVRIHAVFATSRHRPILAGELGPRTHRYLAGVARRMGVGVPAAGGAAEHVHLLLDLPSTLALADCMRILKGASSKWLNKLGELEHGFAWQPGYAAFSVCASRFEATIDYIRGQEKLHATLPFKREYEMFLDVHRLDSETIGGLKQKTGGGS